MAKHYKWPKDCSRCGLCSRKSVFDLTNKEATIIKCPLIITDEFGFVDWEANGWHDITEEYSYIDITNMPLELQAYWLERCYEYEDYWLEYYNEIGI